MHVLPGRTLGYINPDLLYVTSFNDAMYRATGARLVSSFCESASQGRLLLCPESCDPVIAYEEADRILCLSLDNSALLHDWLKQNADIIPISMGGLAPPCHGPEPDNPASEHVKGCVHGWFKKNASRWFRKIVSIKEALRVANARYLIWLDSGCFFKDQVTLDAVIRWFDGRASFTHKSTQRQVIESGILGFDLATEGLQLIEQTLHRYMSGEFRLDERWDDGFQFQATLASHPGISVNDIATVAAGPLKNVAGKGLAGSYIAHEKGIHRFKRIMV